MARLASWRDAALHAALQGALLAGLATCTPAGPAPPGPNRGATDPSPFPPAAVSAGQPPRVVVNWGPLAGYDFERGHLLARAFLSAGGPPPALLPKLLDVTLEGAAGVAGDRLDAVAGAWLGVPWLAGGVEYSFSDHGFTFQMSLRFPFQRGGLLRRGDLLRVDYLPPDEQLLAGLSFPSPFNRYRMTRRAAKEARLPAVGFPGAAPGGAPELSPAIEGSLARIEGAVLWMDRLMTPRLRPGGDFEGSAEGLRAHIRQPGHSFADEEAAYHRELAAAFTVALAGDTTRGRAYARRAEACILSRVVVPYDRRFGREKEPSHAGGFCAGALTEFEGFLDGAAAGDTVAAAARPACREIFRRVLRSVERASRQAVARWRESFLHWDDRGRLAWLPLNYGLQADQYDSQAEWDSLLGALTEQPFTHANTIRYLMMERFHVELKQLIRETERYQVTIVHDFRGQDATGATDIYGWDIVADGYLAAFVRAVRDLDAGRRAQLPQFFLFLDQHYYEANRERGIVSYLEDLFEPPALRFEDPQIAYQVAAWHDSLRLTIAASPTFSGLDRARLRQLFKVHVNITYPFDAAFNLDMTQRDHRKVAFRDVTEDDPAAGAAVFTGQGVGAHYNGTGWEDRSLLVRGSVLVQLKTEVRRLFLAQGFRPDEVPECLRERPYADDYGARCARLRQAGWDTPLELVTNETGYGYKQASVGKAAVYNLAPRGSTVLSFDSLWISDFWAGMFAGAALRGARMFPLGPTPRNAPSNGAPPLYYLRETLDLMFRAQQYFAGDIAAADGALRVGLYAHDAPTTDLRRRIEAFLKSRATQPVLREYFPFVPGVDTLLAEVVEQFSEAPGTALSLRPRPFLHLKYQLFASREGFAITRRPEWVNVLRRHVQIRQEELAGRRTEGLTPAILDTPDPAAPAAPTLIPAFEAELAAADSTAPGRVIYSCSVGSHNQNPRSLLLDGEVLVNISGYHSLVTTADFIFILGIASWPSTRDEFDRLYPPQSLPAWCKPLGRSLRNQL